MQLKIRGSTQIMDRSITAGQLANNLELPTSQLAEGGLFLKKNTSTGTVDLGGYRITTSGNPVSDSDLATKGYVDIQVAAGGGGGGGGSGPNYQFTSSSTVFSTSTTSIDSWSILLYRSARYQIQIVDDLNNFETCEVLVIHDGDSEVLLSERGNVFSQDISMGTFDAYLDAVNQTVILTYTAHTATTKVVRFIRTAIVL